ELALGRVMPVDQHLGQRLRADGAELHRPLAEALRHLEERGVVERPGRAAAPEDRRLPRLLPLVEDVARPERAPAAGRRAIDVAGDAAQPLERIEEPRAAAHREIETRVAGDDVA